MSDQKISIISEKSERLSAAVHLVTGLIKDSEPIKRTLRNESLELVKDTLPQEECSEIVAHTLWVRRIVRVLSILTVARTSGLVSEMNYQLLHREYASLASHIDGQNTFLALAEAPTPTKTQRITQSKLRDRAYDKGHNKRQMSFSSPDMTKGNDQIRHKSLGHGNQEKIRVELKEEKESKVLEFLKDNKNASIKDIHEHIADGSEKTTQRLLMSLITKGHIVKEGERRWSRYSLS